MPREVDGCAASRRLWSLFLLLLHHPRPEKAKTVRSVQVERERALGRMVCGGVVARRRVHGRDLNPDLFSSLNTTHLSKLDRSGKRKIKSTSKSCRCFFTPL
jgi:hypothetical protein